MSVARIVAVMYLVASFSGQVDGQQKSAPDLRAGPDAKAVRILAVGQFLGMFDGMPEYPGHPDDIFPGAKAGETHPYGGILGVKQALTGMGRKAGDILVITGDNYPHPATPANPARTEGQGSAQRAQKDLIARLTAPLDVWTELAALNPAAVALWSEDFYRALSADEASVDEAKKFVELARRPGLRALATNVAVRKHGKTVNTVKYGELALEGVSETASIAWTSTLKIALPCTKDALTFTLSGATTGDVSGKLTGGDEEAALCHVTAKTGTLRPATRYTLVIKNTSSDIGRFAFWTDEALTPLMGSLPIAEPSSDSSQPLVVSMVDPAVRKRLPQGRWEWKEGDEKREIVFLDPADGFKAAKSWTAPSNERYFAMLAGFPDAEIAALVESTETIRIVVLSAGSHLLGRAADERTREDEGKERVLFSGDRGYAGVFEGRRPPLARAWVRPEWIGETILDTTASAELRAAPPSSLPQWALFDLSADVKAVAGYRLCARSTTEPSLIAYTAVPVERSGAPPGSHVIAYAPLYPSYNPNLPYGSSGHPQKGLWISLPEFAALALDTMRSGLDAEIALLPIDFVDADYVGYLVSEHAATGRLDGLSREMLKRVLFRADQIVRVRVAGKDLLSAIEKMLAGSDLCVAGLDNIGCDLKKLDADHLLVNGRGFIKADYYGVAMPASVATEYGLRPDKASKYLVDLVDAAFGGATHHVDTCAATRGGKGTQTATESGLAKVLEDEYASKMQPFLRHRPLEVSLDRTEVHEPAGKNGSLGGVPVTSSGAKDERSFKGETAIDAGFDWLGFTLHATGAAKYGEKEVEKSGTSALTRSFDPDEYKFGVRFDWKFRRGPAPRRLFIGVFERGEFKATRITDPFAVVIRRRHHPHVALGLEADNVFMRKRFEIRQLRASVTRGKEQNERSALRLDGMDVPLTFDLNAAKAAFNELHGTDPTGAEYDFRDAWKSGLELESLVAVPLYKRNGRDAAEFAFTVKARFYKNDPALVLAETRNLQMIAETTLPLGQGFGVALKTEREMIAIPGDNRFSVNRVGIVLKLPWFGKRGAGFIF